MSPARTRLAPSPTGALHLGNARTFLLTWLWARSRGAEVLLRVEDLDGPRTKRGAVEQALEDLRWLGLDHDGEVVHQSTREQAYRDALDALATAGVAYPCVCTRAEIARAQSAPNEGDDGPRYPGTCRGRFASAEEARAATGRDPAWRLVVEPGEVRFEDGVRGALTLDPYEECGDFVIAKKDGQAAYQLAVVVDDAWQGISDVIRGDDLVPSTPRQLLLYRALGLRAPRFAHLPLVRGADGRRLAKRHGDTRISHYRELGVPPERVVGLLSASAGLGARAPRQARELVSAGPLDWAQIPTRDVVFSPAELAWLEGR
ncbi:MAG: tRNA glutamyl-Q(34) synthetase GluQRS [Planctomycetes bacterium]|nr:tRNA glutamyl-Q(34) synthetase GluQRS [Planctomycetota bacterium]